MIIGARECLKMFKSQGELLIKHMDEKGITIGQLAERSNYSSSTIQKYRCNIRNMGEEAMKTLAKELQIDWRELDQNYNENYDNALLEKEYIENINKIKSTFEKMDCYSIYDLNQTFDIYTRMGKVAWNLLVDFNQFNDLGKKKLKDSINNMETTIAEQSKSLNTVLPYLKFRENNYADIKKSFANNSKKFKDEYEFKQKIQKELLHKLKMTSYENVELFAEQIDSVTTMDKDDWNLLIAYTLLNDGFLYMQSKKQDQILDMVDKMVEDKKYVESND